MRTLLLAGVMALTVPAALSAQQTADQANAQNPPAPATTTVIRTPAQPATTTAAVNLGRSSARRRTREPRHVRICD